MKPFRYFVPTEIHFAPGTFGRLAEIAAPLGTKPLLVAGRRSARATGLVARLEKMLPQLTVFEGVAENPTAAVCMEGAEVCRKAGCDCVIGLGGGSAMDAAKAIAVLARNEGNCRQYLGVDRFPNPNLPVICIPTTAGTGSEVTQYAVLVDDEDHSKRTMSGKTLFPVAAILDPELTLDLPRDITVNTGLDALSQGMEGFVSKRSTPPGDVMALEVCRLVRQWLPIAADEPHNLDQNVLFQAARF